MLNILKGFKKKIQKKSMTEFLKESLKQFLRKPEIPVVTFGGGNKYDNS